MKPAAFAYERPRDLAAALAVMANSDGKTRINTIAFISKDDAKGDVTSLEFVKVLKKIADNSGGTFRHVTDDDMGQQ